MNKLYKEGGKFQMVAVPTPKSFYEQCTSAIFSEDECIIGFEHLKEFLELPDDAPIGAYTKADICEVVVCRSGCVVAMLDRLFTHGGGWKCSIETISRPLAKEFLGIAHGHVVMD